MKNQTETDLNLVVDIIEQRLYELSLPNGNPSETETVNTLQHLLEETNRCIDSLKGATDHADISRDPRGHQGS